MYIIKNAMKNISRSLGRNILIGLIALMIAVSSSIALSIKQAATKAEADALDSLSITASISVDRQKIQKEAGTDRETMRELLDSVGNLSLQEMQKYSASPYVSDFNYKIESSVSGSDNFEAYTEEDEVVEADPETFQPPRGDVSEFVNKGGFSGIEKQGDFTIVGYNDEGGMTDFKSGVSKITSGNMFSFTVDNSCIISDTLATYNSLEVGDSIEVTNPNLDSESYVLKVAGIYQRMTDDAQADMRFSKSQDPANQIYTSFGTLTAISKASADSASTSTNSDGTEVTTALRSSVNGTYSFDTISDYENFKAGLSSMGLGEYYSLTSNDVNSYEASLVPIKNLSNFADLFLILVLSIGGVILVVLNIFNIRERKYEVGVLTAIGMKKFKVALQFMTELFMVTFVAIVIGAAGGAVLSVPTADYLLKSQITAEESLVSQQAANFGRPEGGPGGGAGGGIGMGIQSADKIGYLDSINASTDIVVTGKLLGIGVLLTLFSSLGAVVFIVRFEPLKILSNRN